MNAVTLGITAYGGADILDTCLESIQKSVFQEGYSNVDVLVVDDGTPDPEQLKRIAKKHKVGYFRGRRNQGNVARYNTIVERSKGDIVFLIDSDVIIPDRWFCSAFCFLTINKNVGAVSYLSKKVSDVEVNKLLSRQRILADGSGRVPERATELAGYCFGFTRKNYELVGGFDSKNFKYFIGDSDFCCRLAEKGLMSYRLLYPIVYHYEHATYDAHPELKAWERVRQDQANFLKKWGCSPRAIEQGFLKIIHPQQVTWYAHYAVHHDWDSEVPGTLFTKEPVRVVKQDDVPRMYRRADL